MTSDNTYPKKPQNENDNSRVALHYATVPVDLFDDSRIKVLIHTFGALSALIYIRWRLVMSRVSHAFVTRDELFVTAMDFLCDSETITGILNQCLKLGLIDEVSEDEYCIEDILKTQSKLAVNRAAWRERQRKYRERQDTNLSRVTHASVTRDSISIPIHIPKDLNGSNKGGAGGIDPELSERLKALGWGATALKYLEDWITHRIEKKKPLGPTEILAIGSGWAHDRRGFCMQADFAMQNGNTNLYPAPAGWTLKGKP